MRLARAIGKSQTPFTYKQQVQRHQGAQWQIELQYPSMSRAQIAEWQVFLLQMQGRFGTCLIGDPDAATPRGAATGTPLVDSTSAGSPSVNLSGDMTLYTDGWTAGVTNILRKGDYIQLNTGLSAELYMAMEDVNSDGGGAASFDIQPPLRSDAIEDGAIVVNGAKGLFRLLANDTGWDSNEVSRYGFALGFEEAL